ncbi:hypothetical protein [Vibrio neptunius]|uniref:Uncharacterized protein n=1 Tax=Vibrio neptunius TaxID=170651 RepID=A0ABS3A856_9VIBR|nr:hypothetical protein [Vibrio neptunius]MBN3495868.1 hypothetical protein [Vibrio neptunius]MBN3518284.1 hypothetical protein [Vibrio neptunius]MBN3552620.1 hypothetical protein [Vibrio neptunius]MBN3580676.1 hypothetical protein [Vibrio neptunius]MCH9874342.1 hypothetical protein [Vibrio neptunius]
MKRAVAFLDVLGFKDKIDKMSSSELGKEYNQAIKNALGLNSSSSTNGPKLFPYMKKGDPYCYQSVFSDSIILASFDESEENVLKLMIYTLLLTRVMMVQGFILRGGVAYGDMYIDVNSNVFVGEALTKAYQLEMRQDWAGVTIDKSIVTEFPSFFNNNHQYSKFLKAVFVEYPVPFKSGSVTNEFTINWRWNLVVEEGTKSLFSEPTSWDVKRKIDNTLDYALFVRKSKLVSPRKINECPLEIRRLFSAKGEGPPPSKPPQHGDEY